MNEPAAASCVLPAARDSARPSARAARRPATDVITRWPRDVLFDAAAVLAQNPDLQADPSVVADLVYEEYCQRLEAGEVLDRDEFIARFPSFEGTVKRLLSAHQLLLALARAEQAEDPPIPWPKVGDTYLGFHLRGELGRGAFARVFLAAEPALGQRLVAVKIALKGATEAATLGRLQHPYIVPVHSVQVDEKTQLSAVCMPYLGRVTLCDVLRRVYRGPGGPRIARIFLDIARDDRLPPPELRPAPDPLLHRGTYDEGVAWLGLRLAEALAYTHARGIYHGDLKPSNVLLSPDGRPMLLDFNLSLERHIVPKIVGGTLPYMAPEQLRALGDTGPERARGIDGRSDVFSLGVILFELLTGSLPFGPVPKDGTLGEVRDELLRRQQREGLSPVRRLAPHVERSLAGIVERCLALEPADRIPSAADLAAVLGAFLSWRRRLRRWVRRHWRATAAASVAFLAVASAGATYLATRPAAYVRERSQGVAAYRDGDFPVALAHLDQAVRTDPDPTPALFARGRVYQRLGERKAAEEDSYNCLRARKLDEARELDRRGDPERARAARADAKQLEDRSRRAVQELEEWMRLAASDYRSASRQGQDGRVLAALAYCLTWKREYLQAAEYFQEAIRAGYAPAEVYNDLAYCHFRTRGWETGAVRDCLAEALKLDPALPAINANRRWVDLRERRSRETTGPRRIECLADPVTDSPSCDAP